MYNPQSAYYPDFPKSGITYMLTSFFTVFAQAFYESKRLRKKGAQSKIHARLPFKGGELHRTSYSINRVIHQAGWPGKGISVQLRQLEYAVALVQWKTMRKAAQHLYVSEATISQQIRELETELGLSLFQREGRGLKLTNEGEKLLPFIERLLQARTDLEKQASEMKALIPDTLRFGVVPSIAWQFLPDILTHFHATYAQVRLEVQESPSYNLLALLQDQQIDIAVVAYSERVPFESKGMVMKPLIQTELVALASPQHRLATRREITQKQLSREQIIVTREGFVARDLVLAVLGQACEENILYSTDHVLTSLRLVQAGTGIFFLPRFILTQANASQWHNLQILSLAPELAFPLSYVCLYPTQHMRPPWFHAFLNLLQTCCHPPDCADFPS